MRRILIFSLAYYPRFVGGAEVAIKEITDRILPTPPESGIEFDMVTLGDGRGIAEEKIGNVTVHRIFKKAGIIQKFLFPFMAARKAGELHRRALVGSTAGHGNYDAIWSIMASYAGYAGYLFKRKNPETFFLLTIQEGDHFGRRILLRPLFKRIFSSADRIQAISQFLKDWSVSMGAKCPIDLVPNAVDIELFSRKISLGEMDELKNRFQKKEDDILLITTSRLVPKNAVGDIISALEYLPENIKLLVLGSGPDEAKLRAQAKSYSENRVQFLDYISHAEMPKYLQISEIFVRPSLSEGLGNSFLEAMAAGIPIIGTPVGGIPDFLKDGETGLFCEVNNPRSIAQKVEKLIKDRESREYITRQAKELVKNKYQWETVAEKMKDILGRTW